MDESIQKQLEAPARIGNYQHYADAMLMGCAVTSPIKSEVFDGMGGACALGALRVGMGEFTSRGRGLRYVPGEAEMRDAYFRVYGTTIERDNDLHGRTREQIAARIAAL